MENVEVIEVKEKKKNKKLIRFLIGVTLVVLSCATGLISGIQIAKITSTNQNGQGEEQNQHINELIQVLKDNWMSEIYYGTNNINEDLLIRQFAGALSSSEKKQLDPYTYLIKEEDPIYVPALGKLGITLTNFYNLPVITEVDKRGTAYNYLKPGDIVVTLGKLNAIGGYELVNITDKGITFSNMFNVGLGRPNQKQYIKVARFDELNKMSYHEFEINLGNTLPTQYSYLMDEDIDDTIMVKLTGFTTDKDNKQGTSDQLSRILEDNPCSNIIIDLRNNGGGDLSSALDVCDLFLPKDKLVTTLQFKNGRKSEYVTKNDEAYEFDNIIILQNGSTASASEIMIAALSYHLSDKVTLVGTKSYGKGIAQSKVKVFEGAYTLQYTCAKWFGPDGNWLGMTINDDDNVGFNPLNENKISNTYLLALMEYCNYYMRSYGYNFLKDDSEHLAFKVDKVATENQFFFEIYNKMFNTSVRTDTYFDESCVNAIKDYQTLKGISEVSGTMNLDTLVHFTNDYYVESKSYNDLFINKAKEIIEK